MFKSLLLCLVVLAGMSRAHAVTDNCLYAMQNVYKFYYHEIHPKPGTSPSTPEAQLGKKEALQMQIAISELQAHCPPDLIAKMNAYLTNEATSATRD